MIQFLEDIAGLLCLAVPLGLLALLWLVAFSLPSKPSDAEENNNGEP
jgi:hypothetical protein